MTDILEDMTDILEFLPDLTRPVASEGASAWALRCACNVYRAIDRRMPEASVLASWLNTYAAGLGLPENSLPADDRSERSRRSGVPGRDWDIVRRALDLATVRQSEPDKLDRWVAAFERRLALDAQETLILSLVLRYAIDDCMEQLYDDIARSRCRPSHITAESRLIALLLAIPRADIENRLTGGAKLFSSGLLSIGSQGQVYAMTPLVNLIRRDTSPAADIYDQLLGATSAVPMAWDAFRHLGREAEVVAELLRAAVTGQETGVNILLYGPPGTGKTSFAATLAERIGARLRPVAETDVEGNEPTRDQRLAGLRLAQRLAEPGNTVLLFDEAEDLFVKHFSRFGEARTSSRIFMHRLLEGMAVPVIWTANDIEALGPTVLRRMTMCLELKIPTLAARTVLWRRMGEAEGIPLEEADAARLARLVPAAPAVASAALRATRLAGGGPETARLIVEGIARAVGGGRLTAPEAERVAIYDPTLVNADCDLATLEADLVRPGASKAVSLLLSGPPGAGKSAWIRYLAGRMGLPVLQKRASDLLDPYVGGTEHNIAGAFAEARDTGAFLVFDEADSLLLERADAVRSWEISEVNEMLTWMESHALPFACTTNLPERLDRASLRRFLVKLRFSWLTEAQARLAFRRFFDLPAPAELDALRTLTPADFALVRRRVVLRRDPPDAATLLRLLSAESTDRIGSRGRIGFGTEPLN
jgi:SpoVK/Ycf46/Vps4 family AAA+-type ATPase